MPSLLFALRRRRAAAAAVLAGTALLAGCGGQAAPAADPAATPPAARTTPGTTTPTTEPSSAPTPSEDPNATAVLAFGGDIHFEGSAEATIDGGFGSAFQVLRKADVAVVNLETAITSGGDAAPKQYTFRAPPEALDALRESGVDVVTLANNHGMDFGQDGLQDTLAAERESGLPIIGAGRDAAEAFAPWRTTVNGIDVSVLAATDVLDTFAIDAWTATADMAGLASSKEPSRLLAAVKRERQRADVVVVFLHWGVEGEVCATARQQELARLLSDAGADIVVGSHAHVLQPQDTVGSTYVHYGLGNFVWYSHGGVGALTGVATVTVNHDGVVRSAWHPATISNGRPELAEGADRTSLRQQFASLCTG